MIEYQKSAALGIGLLICLSACLPLDAENASTEFYLERSSFSYAVFETDATAVMLEVHADFPPTFMSVTDLTIDDGTQAVSFGVDEIKPLVTHEMPPGPKRVTVTSGGQVKLDGVIAGLYVDKITFNAPAEKLAPPLDRVFVYSDSLALGGEVQFASREAWPILLREQFVVFLEAYGYRMLFDDASTPRAQEELASQVQSFSPNYIWIAIGTNDYSFGVWTPQDFGSAYRSLIDTLHEAAPAAIIFAQSPIHRVDEETKVVEYPLDDYREEVEQACASKPEWCTFVDGTSSWFPQIDDLASDGVHLTRTGNLKYADAVVRFVTDR